MGQICNSLRSKSLTQQLINHYGMNMREPQAKRFLYTRLEGLLFKAGEQKEA